MGLSLYYWYRYVEKKFSPEVALFSLFVLMSAHLFLKNFSQIMLDGISFSFTLLFMYALDFWHTSKKRKHLFLSLAFLLILLLIAFKTYFLLFYPLVILTEKKRMKELFPDEYEEYRKKTPLFLPSLKPFSSGKKNRFSWRNFRENKEWRAVFGTGFFWLILLCKFILL